MAGRVREGNARTWRVFMTLGVAFIFARGCGEEIGNDSTLVGGSCHDHHDCEHRCVRGGDFPNGTCTVDCHDDGDCPGGTRCVDRAGGICLLACHDDHDCRGGYDCKRVDREGHGGKIAVCID
jgi:hypothetical protein